MNQSIYKYFHLKCNNLDFELGLKCIGIFRNIYNQKVANFLVGIFLDKKMPKFYANQKVANFLVGFIKHERIVPIMAHLRNKYGPWVSGDDFFDREADVRHLTGLIDEGNNTLIVAPRRVGKTSLVRETFRRMGEHNNYYLLYADVQHCSTPEDVIVAISLEAYPHQALRNKVLGAFNAFWRQFRDNAIPMELLWRMSNASIRPLC